MVEDMSFEDDQLASMTNGDIVRAPCLLDKENIRENQVKIKLNKQLPFLVANMVKILEMNPEVEADEDGANIDLDSQRKGKCDVLKTSTRQVNHEDFNKGIIQVQAKKKASLNYYA